MNVELVSNDIENTPAVVMIDGRLFIRCRLFEHASAQLHKEVADCEELCREQAKGIMELVEKLKTADAVVEQQSKELVGLRNANLHLQEKIRETK